MSDVAVAIVRATALLTTYETGGDSHGNRSGSSDCTTTTAAVPNRVDSTSLAAGLCAISGRSTSRRVGDENGHCFAPEAPCPASLPLCPSPASVAPLASTCPSASCCPARLKRPRIDFDGEGNGTRTGLLKQQRVPVVNRQEAMRMEQQQQQHLPLQEQLQQHLSLQEQQQQQEPQQLQMWRRQQKQQEQLQRKQQHEFQLHMQGLHLEQVWRNEQRLTDVNVRPLQLRESEKADDKGFLLVDLPVDGYSWLKYGEKSLQGRAANVRSYFKCTHSATKEPKGSPCTAKKRVDWRLEGNPVTFTLEYVGQHNHEAEAKPRPHSQRLPVWSNCAASAAAATGAQLGAPNPSARALQLGVSRCSPSATAGLSLGAPLSPLVHASEMDAEQLSLLRALAVVSAGSGAAVSTSEHSIASKEKSGEPVRAAAPSVSLSSGPQESDISHAERTSLPELPSACGLTQTTGREERQADTFVESIGKSLMDVTSCSSLQPCQLPQSGVSLWQNQNLQWQLLYMQKERQQQQQQQQQAQHWHQQLQKQQHVQQEQQLPLRQLQLEQQHQAPFNLVPDLDQQQGPEENSLLQIHLRAAQLGDMRAAMEDRSEHQKGIYNIWGAPRAGAMSCSTDIPDLIDHISLPGVAFAGDTCACTATGLRKSLEASVITELPGVGQAAQGRHAKVFQELQAPAMVESDMLDTLVHDACGVLNMSHEKCFRRGYEYNTFCSDFPDSMWLVRDDAGTLTDVQSYLVTGEMGKLHRPYIPSSSCKEAALTPQELECCSRWGSEVHRNSAISQQFSCHDPFNDYDKGRVLGQTQWTGIPPDVEELQAYLLGNDIQWCASPCQMVRSDSNVEPCTFDPEPCEGM